MALARSAGSGNVLAMIAIATGLSIVPPTACSARAAISQPMPGARPHSSEPSPKAARPTWKTRRRPTRSAVDPASTRKLASTRVYASTVHCRPDTEACRSRRIAGQRDVDDGDVHHHDDDAGAADREHQEPAALAELAGQSVCGRSSPVMTSTLGFRACSKSSRGRYPARPSRPGGPEHRRGRPPHRGQRAHAALLRARRPGRHRRRPHHRRPAPLPPARPGVDQDLHQAAGHRHAHQDHPPLRRARRRRARQRAGTAGPHGGPPRRA